MYMVVAVTCETKMWLEWGLPQPVYTGGKIKEGRERQREGEVWEVIDYEEMGNSILWNSVCRWWLVDQLV